jgi:pathogenesis-related protein 1
LAQSVSAQTIGFDANEMLDAHNRWRKTVGVPSLTYSDTLAASAQQWANHLMQSNQCQMEHSTDVNYGENLFWGGAIQWSNGKLELQKVNPNKVVDAWGEERVDYDYQSNDCAPDKVCGHYTQVVWRTTSTVGCAVAVCEDTREQVWVCQYQPPGNWEGEKPY